jgi:hypothetical protein
MTRKMIPPAPTTAKPLTPEDRALIKRACRNKHGEALAVALYVSSMARNGNYYVDRGNKVIALARGGDGAAQKALGFIVAEFLNGGSEIPSSLRAYITDQLQGKIRSRRGRGRDPYANSYRNYVVTCAIHALVKQGLPPTRNRAATPRAISACRVAASALKEMAGIHLSESAVEKIYYEQCRKMQLSRLSVPNK